MSGKIIPLPVAPSSDSQRKARVEEHIRLILPRAMLHVAAQGLSEIADVDDRRAPLTDEEFKKLCDALDWMAAVKSMAREGGAS